MKQAASITLLFPGQGSQYRGIGSDLHQQHAIVADTYQEASDVLGYDIADLSFHDQQDTINLTRFTQPVLLTHSIACLRVLQQQLGEQVKANFAAGHSLGEYSALVAAGALSFSDGLRLVKKRGELMGEYGSGEMEALSVDLASAKALAEDHHCQVAACNMPEQTVVGGRSADLDALVADMQERFPRKRSARLKTEGAFHTYYMVEAAIHFRDTLAEINFADTTCEVMSNYSGAVHGTDAQSIRSRLFLQLFNPVMWHSNLSAAHEQGSDLMIEFGGGLGQGDDPSERRPNLEGIVKKTFRRSENPPKYLSVINQQTLEATVATLNA